MLSRSGGGLTPRDHTTSGSPGHLREHRVTVVMLAIALVAAAFGSDAVPAEAFGSRTSTVSEASAAVPQASSPESGLPEPHGTPDPGAAPTPAPSDPVGDLPRDPEPSPSEHGSLAVGVTEPNPNLMWPGGTGVVPPAFAPWRDAVGALRPHYYRLQVDWSKLQPDAGVPPDFDGSRPGCMRDLLPCGPWQGLRVQLQALAARQSQGGWEAVVSISGTPAWAARSAGGCEQEATNSYSRAPRTDALADYARLVEQIIATAQDEGAELRWWNAWNEPNHPYFLSPQRLTCDPASSTESVSTYVNLHAALGEALERAPGEQRRTLGDLAGVRSSGPHSVSVRDFIAALPRDVVCETSVWAQHSYLAPRDDATVARRALAKHECGTPHEIWVTETGARNSTRDPAPHIRCRSMDARLRRWWSDPQITAAFQYTVREDDRFPYGLITTDLQAAYPVMGLWQAWGGVARPSPSDAPPDADSVCPEPPADG